MSKNITGDAFDDYVKEQIEIRQEVLGNNEFRNLYVNNTKTAWIRLTSSVNLTEGTSETPGDSVLNLLSRSLGVGENQIKDDFLAKKFVLFGGAISYSTDLYPNYLIDRNQPPLNNESFNFNVGVTPVKNLLKCGISNGSLLEGAYGFGSPNEVTDERGFVPPPGITKASLSYKNDGALAIATINIKAFNRSQFQIIDILFQRPGYSALLEFGNSIFFNNRREIDNISNSPTQDLFLGGKTSEEILDLAMIERRKNSGNYECLLGVVSKFNWKANSDGSFDITVNLVGVGDVINSLKLNTISLKGKKMESITDDSGGNLIVAKSLKSNFHNELKMIYFNYNDWNLWEKIFWDNVPNKSVTLHNKYVFKPIGIDITDSRKEYKPTYISFGFLLTLLNKHLNFLSTDKTKNNFDFNILNIEGENSREVYINTFPGNFSSDPSKCLVTVTDLDKVVKLKKPESQYIIERFNTHVFVNSPNSKNITKQLKYRGYKFQVDNEKYLGKLINVYLDMSFIFETLESVENKDGEIIIKDFIQNILDEINKCLGKINNPRIIIDDKTNLISIANEVPLMTFEEEKEHSTINTFGLDKGDYVNSLTGGSFVRDMSLNSELTEQFATQMSVAALANKNPNKPQSNAMSFAIYNKGLEDRVFKYDEPEESLFFNLTKNFLEKIKKQKEEYPFEEILTEDIFKIIFQVYVNGKFTSEYLDSLSNWNVEFCSLVQGKLVSKSTIPVPSFIPFNLSLTIDGLAGMRIYQTFKIDGKMLPLNYNPNNIDLIIKNLSHNIEGNDWTTIIETLSRPLYKIEKPNIEKIMPPTTKQEEKIAPFLPPPSSVPSPPEAPPYYTTPSSDQLSAIKSSHKYVFGEWGNSNKYCGRYTFNLAYNYLSYLRGAPTKLQIGLEADAKSEIFKNLLIGLGYKFLHAEVNQPKSKVIDRINNEVWRYGDVIVYYTIDGGGNPQNYGHAQIFVGKDVVLSNWASSLSDNYNTNFVYKNRNGTKWNLYIFKAPQV